MVKARLSISNIATTVMHRSPNSQASRRVYQTVVILRAMPLANLTQIPETVRNQIAMWFESLDDM